MERLTIEEILDHCKRKTEMYERNVKADYLDTAPMMNPVKMPIRYKIIEPAFELKMLANIGTRIFLTREEAGAKLNEMKGE